MVAEALESEEAYRKVQELVNDARDIVARTCADDKPHVGLLLLDCHLAALYSEDGMRDLRKLILAPEEEADWSSAEPGSREFKQRALVFAAKRFAMALAEKLGIAEVAEDTHAAASIPAEENTNAEGVRREHECITTEDTLIRRAYAPYKPQGPVEDTLQPAPQPEHEGGFLFRGTAQGEPQHRQSGCISSEDTPDDNESTAEDTAPPHPMTEEGEVVPGEDNSSVPSAAVLMSRIEQLQGMLEEQERYAADLERRLREQEQAAAKAIAERDAEIRSLKQQVDLYAQRIKNLERLNRRLAAQMDALLTGKKGEKIANAMRVLLTIKSMGGEAQVSQLCEAIGWKRAQVWRYLRALRESGFVVESRGKYRTTNQVNRVESERELREMLVLRWADTGHLNRPLSEPRTSRQ